MCAVGRSVRGETCIVTRESIPVSDRLYVSTQIANKRLRESAPSLLIWWRITITSRTVRAVPPISQVVVAVRVARVAAMEVIQPQRPSPLEPATALHPHRLLLRPLQPPLSPLCQSRKVVCDRDRRVRVRPSVPSVQSTGQSTGRVVCITVSLVFPSLRDRIFYSRLISVSILSQSILSRSRSAFMIS